jgi:hypothetical protein
MRSWFAFLFDIHVSLGFSTPKSFLSHMHITRFNFSTVAVWRSYQKYLLNKTIHLIEDSGVNLLSSRESSVIRKVTYYGRILLLISLCTVNTPYVRIQAG